MATPNDSRPNRNLLATVVDTDPPQQNAWPNWAPSEQGHGAWPTKKKVRAVISAENMRYSSHVNKSSNCRW